ncbi:MAG: hypothetical protein M1830_003465 [Pleopsidium flavum]|nr:MAG: hypothetical protein M1830_003465 [Pleopsidium flavum]
MSRIRGVFPLFLATTFGILNGVATFGPAFKDQEKQRLEKEQEGVEASKDPVPEEVQTSKDVETVARAGATTESVPDSIIAKKAS